MIPNFKVSVTHSGTTKDYINYDWLINVKRRVCNYDVATLTAKDPFHDLYASALSKFDNIQISAKIDQSLPDYTLIFGGNIRQLNPIVGTDSNLIINCKGYGAALEDTHCNRGYGIESSSPSYPQPWNIWTNLIDEFVEKSFDGAATGYTLDHTLITDTFATDIKYLNNPYRTNLEVVDTVCNLTCAIGAGATAGAEWIVDPEAYFMVAKIGDHAAGAGSPETRWPDWWNTDQTGSTLEQGGAGADFSEFNILDKAEEYANHVILVTDFRRPAFDYWTENHAALWDYDDLASLTAIDTDKVVGTHSIRLLGNNTDLTSVGWYPAAKDAAWDTTKWGSSKTIPYLNFYVKKDASVSEADTYISLFTSADMLTDSFTAHFNLWTEPDGEWIHKSLPIGPYWATSEESKLFRWTVNGSADWTEINGIAFFVNVGLTLSGSLLIDDLHFSGKIVRSAKDTSEITDKKEIQKVLIARNSMDDSCVAADDSGFAARIAYAELLRRAALPITVSFTVEGKPSMMPGQKMHFHGCRRPDNTFAKNLDMRILQVEHNIDMQGFWTTVTATSDLLNSQPISVPDQYAMWQENMFLNSNEAKNIRAGAEVDLLIPRLESDY